jgi:thiamine kinase-like enzyme
MLSQHNMRYTKKRVCSKEAEEKKRKLRVNRVELFLGEGWDVMPAGGATGEAYVAKHGDYQLFIKRNSSPFLAVLSAEGIVPKLLWTKRLESGDVITAQRWIQGRELKAKEMMNASTAAMLSNIHRSNELLDLFKRMGNEPLDPRHMVENMYVQIQLYRIEDELVLACMDYLERTKDQLGDAEYAVCHGDINHNNWMRDEQDNLYLIDWDGASVADPALDLGLMLYTYIPEEHWATWLAHYGAELDHSLKMRMHWYVVAHTISEILWNHSRGQFSQVEELKKALMYVASKNDHSD